MEGKKGLILGMIIKFWAHCLVFYTKKIKILLNNSTHSILKHMILFMHSFVYNWTTPQV